MCSSAAASRPWTHQNALELRAGGGNAAMTVPAPDTIYEVRCRATMSV